MYDIIRIQRTNSINQLFSTRWFWTSSNVWSYHTKAKHEHQIQSKAYQCNTNGSIPHPSVS